MRVVRDEGRREAKRMGGGPVPRITGQVEAAMLGLAGAPDHPSLTEIAARLAAATGVRVHLTRCTRRCGERAGRERG